MNYWSDYPHIDRRRVTGVHEAGHVIAFHEAGVDVTSVWIDDDDSGTTTVEDDAPVTRGYAAALLAGQVAVAIWLHRDNGFGYRDALDLARDGAYEDDEMFEGWSDHVRLSRYDGITHAERVLQKRWDRVEKLADRLLKKTELAGKDL